MSIPVLDGIITVLTTPFDAAGAINFDVLGRHFARRSARSSWGVRPRMNIEARVTLHRQLRKLR
jgi:hypothetical protein